MKERIQGDFRETMKGVKDQSVLIRTLSGYRLLQTAKVQQNNDAIRYFYEYNADNRYDISRITKTIEESDNCAYFYQLSQVLGKELIFNHLVFVDFSNPRGGSLFDYKRYQRKLRDLFENGIIITIDKKERLFVPGDRSDSMSRHNKISFIDAEFKDALDRRLNLVYEDVESMPTDEKHYAYKKYNEMTRNELCLSKYFSYRGKYLSTGRRVTHEKFDINDETLVILPIIAHKKVNDVNLITAGSKDFYKWNIYEPKKNFFKIDQVYDGEGLISPKYAKYINEALGVRGATSFQIRLPYVKGMLHEVDFHGFIREYAKSNGQPMYKEGDSFYIKDIFGRVRDLSKAQIIIDESMFKILSMGFDMNKSCGRYEQQPFFPDWYFDGIKKYDHGMYVVQTNLSLKKTEENETTTELSYQVLNPLALSTESVAKLVEKQEEYIEDPIRYLRETQGSYQGENWQILVRKDQRFETDAYVKSQLQGIQHTLIYDLGEGNVRVIGENRFLSRDLLPYLKRLLEDLTYEDGKRVEINMYHYRKLAPLGRYSFYMPGNNIGLKPHTWCAFFRSPHLSRNEECVLNSYEVKTKSVYDRYFSHLTGIVMIPCDSMVAHIMGGADFDGDMVKVINNELIVDAVIKGCYENNGADGLKRKLPVINIPSVKSNKDRLEAKSIFEVVENTFSNRVGQISNMAIRIGQKQYSSDEQSDKKRSCEACTILTGLEIDAAKSGKHPDLGDILGKKSSEKVFDYIEDVEKLIKEKKGQKIPWRVEETDGGNFYELKETKNADPVKKYRIEELKNGTTLANVSYHYLKALAEHRSYEPSSDKGAINKVRKNDKNYPEYKKLTAVIKAYYDTKELDGRINQQLSNFRNKNYAGDINVILQLQYDVDVYEKMLANVDEAREVLLEVYMGQTADDAKMVLKSIDESIGNLSEMHWNYMRTEKEKRSVLKKIVPCQSVEQVDSLMKTVSNFNHQGYKLLYYLLLDVKQMMAETLQTKELVDQYIILKDFKSEKKIKKYDAAEYKSAFSDFTTILYKGKDNKTTQKHYRKEILFECKKRLEKYNVNEPEQIRLVYSIDPKKEFFWTYYSADEIESVIEKEASC